MDDNAAILREDSQFYADDSDTAWKTVSYPRRQRKLKNTSLFNRNQPELSSGRRGVPLSLQDGSTAENDDVTDVIVAEVGNADVSEASQLKPKKPKKPKMSVSEAAAKIDADYLDAYLADISVTYESQPDIQLMRFADFFGRAFASVGSSQFPWIKMLKESNFSKLVDIPLWHVTEAVYKTSIEWLGRQSMDALGSFVLWLWDDILEDLAIHQGIGKASKKVSRVQPPPSKCQVARFVVLAMALRRKPEILISLLTILNESQKYFGQEKLPVTVWVITQACQGDLVVGLYMWIQVLLPMLCGKSVNPQSRDLILQLLERILSTPKSRQILLNGAVRKGERLVPAEALVSLMKLAFPLASARIKATDRFEAAYPTLKEVALAGSPGSKGLKQVSLQIFGLAIKAADEGVPELSSEAADVVIWCLTENPECYKQWENSYLDHIEASVVVLKKLAEGKKLLSNLGSTAKSSMEPVQATLHSIKKKTETALAREEFGKYKSSLKEADKYCKCLLAVFSNGWGNRAAVVVSIIAVTAALVYIILPNDEPCCESFFVKYKKFIQL